MGTYSRGMNKFADIDRVQAEGPGHLGRSDMMPRIVGFRRAGGRGCATSNARRQSPLVYRISLSGIRYEVHVIFCSSTCGEFSSADRLG